MRARSRQFPGRWLAAAAIGIAFALATGVVAWQMDDPWRAVILVALGVVVGALVFWKLPQWQAESALRHKRGGSKSAFELENDARRTLAEALGGLFLVVGLAVTWVQLDQNRDQAASDQALTREQAATEQALTREEQQVISARAATEQALTRAGQDAAATRAAADRALDQQGQLTGRFTDAVGQLGDTRLQIRLGGLYALERIARDSKEDAPTVLEVLAAFVRERAPWPLPSGTPTPVPDAEGRYHPPADVQAVLTVIERGQWAAQMDREDLRRLGCLDLSRTDLRGVHFGGTTLLHFCLQGANLAGANLAGANLASAYLAGADLTGANLMFADLRDADLTRADLTRANLAGTQMQGADLPGADLRGANLWDANLTNADLPRAKLGCLDQGEGTRQCTDLMGAYLAGADLTGADLTGANLTRAVLTRAVLTDAVLAGVQNLTQAQIESAIGAPTPTPPPDVRPPTAPRPTAASTPTS